jgi:DNA-binding MarR family transcriptional regulator
VLVTRSAIVVDASMPESRGDARVSNELDDGAALGQLLGYQLALASIATRKLYTRHVGEPIQLKPVEFTILMLLLVNEEVTPKRLGHALAVSAPNLTILLDRLQRRELVTRVRSETDRRSQHVHLTRKGQALAKKAQDIALTMENELARTLSAAEKAMLIELLRKVSRHRGA